MAVTGVPISGQDGRVMYDGVILNMASYKVTPKIGKIITTNFESNNYAEKMSGTQDCDFEISGMYDRSNTPFASAGLTPGIKGPLKIYVSRTSNAFFSFPSWLLEEAPVESKAENEMVRISFRGSSDGPFFFPTA